MKIFAFTFAAVMASAAPSMAMSDEQLVATWQQAQRVCYEFDEETSCNSIAMIEDQLKSRDLCLVRDEMKWKRCLFGFGGGSGAGAGSGQNTSAFRNGSTNGFNSGGDSFAVGMENYRSNSPTE